MDYDMLYNKPSPSELYHYGLKGQRKGVRNAEWYPIAAFKKSRARFEDFKEKQKEKQEKRFSDKLEKANRQKQLAELKYETQKIKSATKEVKKGKHVSLSEDENPEAIKVKKQKDISQLTDEELSAGITRLSNEKKYRDLMLEMYGGQGKLYLKQQLAKVPGDVAKKTLTDLGSKYLTQAVSSKIDSAIDKGKKKNNFESKSNEQQQSDRSGILGKMFKKGAKKDGEETIEHVKGEFVGVMEPHVSSGKSYTDDVIDAFTSSAFDSSTIYQPGPTVPRLMNKSGK